MEGSWQKAMGIIQAKVFASGSEYAYAVQLEAQVRKNSEKEMAETKEEKSSVKIEFNAHKRMFMKSLQSFPMQYQYLEANRMTLLHFVMCGIDIMNFLDDPAVNKSRIIDWIYNLQIASEKDRNALVLRLNLI